MPDRLQAGARCWRVALLAILLWLAALSSPAPAAPAATVKAASQEIIGIRTRSGAVLQTRVLRSAGPGPFPLAIVSHGSPPDASQRPAMQVPTYASASNWLLERGYMVGLPLRRGYGETGGRWVENYGSCSSPDYYRAGLTTAEDIRTAADFFRDRSDVRRDRVVLIGVSAGGWGSLAAASQNPPGVAAVINFAGGRGGHHPKVGNCAPQGLVAAAGRYGSTARIPTLWLYAANDSFFAPDLARRCSMPSFAPAGAPSSWRCRPSAA